MTTNELVMRLRELDPDGNMPVVIADDLGNFERAFVKIELMVSDGDSYDFPDDEDDDLNNAVEVILL